MASLTIFNSESDEDSWVEQINQLVSETNLSILNNIPICIYQVPKSLSCAKPEAYAPQLIAIGPYNHFRPELYPMERFKIFAAKRVLDHFKKPDLEHLVKELHNIGPFIRACYHKYLDLKENTLLYTMALDGLFLLDFLHKYLDEKVSGSFMKGLEERHVQIISGVKLTKDAIIRDIFMVENQFPILVLFRILELENSTSFYSHSSVEECLGSMLLSLCEKHSPLKLTHTPTCSEAVSKHCHILDIMYHLVVAEEEKLEILTHERQGMHTDETVVTIRSSKSEDIVKLLKKFKGLLTFTLGILRRLKDTDIPLPKAVKQPLDTILNMSTNIQNVSSSGTPPFETEAPPVVVTIPSVRELQKVGIHFQPSKGGITAIEFDEKKGIFYLPVLKLDVNSEVIMRNLVAHEALTKPDFLIFTRYTELMRGIIDTVEDVKLLKNEGIIESSSSLSVEETEELFNGMSKSIGPTKTEKLDESIKKVNKYFHDKKKANPWSYVYSSWKMLTLVATFVLLAMTALQTVCTVYDCPGHFTSS